MKENDKRKTGWAIKKSFRYSLIGTITFSVIFIIYIFILADAQGGIALFFLPIYAGVLFAFLFVILFIIFWGFDSGANENRKT